MCGICGIVNFNASKPVDRNLIERMTSAQAHRGPDDHGIFVGDNAGLGHRRLSIIDLSGGAQPIFNEDDSVVIVFNGEIYNYADLTADLIARGHRFKTRSDTETIIHAYEEYGDECVEKFRGMFAFAIWDRKRRRMFVARDRFGIKPVYYHVGKDFIAIASEIKSLFEDPRVPREVDAASIDLYMALRYVPGPQTAFKGIFKLQPGHTMAIDQNGTRIRKYWDLQYDDSTRGRRDIQQEFEHLLEEAVKLRLIAEVPLGVFLSGGLDSSATVALMSKITGNRQVKTFSVGYETNSASRKEAVESNEFSYAREAAAHFGAEHHEYHLTAGEFESAIPKMVSHLDEPLADPSCIPLYFISRLAREHITVVLSGEGADEILGGYNLYQRVLGLEKMRNRVGPLSSLAPLIGKLPIGERLRNYLRRASTPLEMHYRGVVKGVLPETRLKLTGEERLVRCEQNLDDIFGAYFRNVTNASALNRMLYADAKVWLPENLLLKADKMTMATAVELRVPFLDHKLAEFSANLPQSFKIRDGQGKWILRQAMGRVLPPSILHRTKKGFPSPTASWLRLELRDFVHDTLLAQDAACRKFFSEKAVADVISQHEAGKFSGYQEVWSLIVFEQWHRQFIANLRPAVESNMQGYYVVNS